MKRAPSLPVRRDSPPPAPELGVFGPNEPLALLYFGFRAVVKKPDEELARFGLGRVHHRVLFFIARSPGLSASELLRTLGITKQALHGPLRRLQSERLVQSRRDPANARQLCLTLTPRGRALERRLSGHQRDLFAAAFRRVGAEAREGYFAVMRALAEGADT